MTQQTSSPPSRRRGLWLVLGGGGLLALCACLALALAGGAYWWFVIRSPAAANASVVEYILDASPRMRDPSEGGTRLSVAQAVMSEIIRPADTSVTAGLRVFGTGVVPEACQDTDLLVPLAPANQGRIADQVSAVDAGNSADSALGEAMIAAVKDLASTPGPHSLVVVTGGVDSCNPQVGALIAEEAKRAGIDLQSFVIGFQVDDAQAEAIKSMVGDLPGSTFLDAQDVGQLTNVLIAVQNHIDDPSTTSLADVVAAATPGAVVTQAVAIAPTAAGNGYPSQTACDHPYFPLRSGSTWQYTSEGATMTWTVTGVSGDLTSASADVAGEFNITGAGAMTMNYNWTCGLEGINWYNTGSMSFGSESGSGNLTMTSRSGVTLPPVEALVPGATWQDSYTMHYEVTAAGTSMSIDSDVTESNTLDGMETLTVDGKPVDAIRVASSGTTTTMGNSYSWTTTIWYGYGIGIVRSVSGGDSGSSTLELVSYNIP